MFYSYMTTNIWIKRLIRQSFDVVGKNKHKKKTFFLIMLKMFFLIILLILLIENRL